MFGNKCCHWNNNFANLSSSDPGTLAFSLPAPIPQWPPGRGFSSGRIHLGDMEVVNVSRFEFIWGDMSHGKHNSVSFYKPVGIPDDFHCLGHYCQSNTKPLRGFVLAARELVSSDPNPVKSPALLEPTDYTLVWSSNDLVDENYEGYGYFWLPRSPSGYKAMGYLVTNTPAKPQLNEVRCVRADLTDKCELYRIILKCTSKINGVPFWVRQIRPSDRGMLGRGVSVGTFFCTTDCVTREELDIACLKNLDPNLHAMPNVDQIHAIINHYGPTVFFHPDEVYLPSSVSWFFSNGALLYRRGNLIGQVIDTTGSNLPSGGTNDREFWIDLPLDQRGNNVKYGNLQSAKLYVHVKPAIGGTYTDIVMWVFCPFNGPATLKLGLVNIPLTRVGQHVGDWEHFTLRINNFTGEIWSIYFSQHSGGEWVDSYDLEYIEGNKAIIYSTKCGHASFPHPGTYIQGSQILGIGIRNDAVRSHAYVDSSASYELVAAEYLGEGVVPEPGWLQFMREWGPTVVYDSKTELDKIVNRLPSTFRNSVSNILSKIPVELSREEGPTGPKEKNNWVGDERS